jgi:hypothetical protein
MADEQEPSGPSLEPPSFFRRKRKDAPPAPEPVAEQPAEQPAGSADDSPTTILDEAPVAPGPKPSAPPPLFADEVPQTPVPEPEGPVTLPKPPKPPREGPIVPGRAAAAIAGLLVGAVIVGLTTASFELCSRIQGTNSCGGPGIFLLLAILVLAVVLGTVVLRLCQVPEPGSTSFLAVGLTSVIALLFLIDALFEWWMIIALPIVSVATFLLSHWVTATFVEPTKPDQSPVDDDWFHHIR